MGGAVSVDAESITLDDLPIRDDLRGRRPYGAPQLEVAVRLNTNENSYRLPEPVVKAVAEEIAAVLPDLNRYPDRDAVTLREQLAQYVAPDMAAADRAWLTSDNLWAANGSNEVLQQLLQVFGGPGRSALGFTPAYSMHPLLAMGTVTGWIDGHRGPDFSLTAADAAAQVRAIDPTVVFLCSPNNPTGTALEFEVVEAVLEVASGMVVVDEAYTEFRRPGTPSAVSLLPRYPRLVVTRTMSKAFAFAGVRIGYLAAHRAVVDAVQLVRLPYHLSSLTQAAARAALSSAPALLSTVEAIKEQRDRIVADLRGHGLVVGASDANFVLFEVPGGDQRAAWRFLLDRGVLVRDVGLPGWLRVTAGTPAETDAFLAGMAALVAKGESR